MMKHPMPFGKRATAAAVVVTVAAVVFATMLLKFASAQTANTNLPQAQDSAVNAPQSEAAVDLAPGQLDAIKIEPVGTYRFAVEKEAVGSVSYDEAAAARAAPGPHSAANLSTKRIVADVAESDGPLIHVKQPVRVKVIAYPGRVFDGRITALGGSVWDLGGNPAVDPNIHRIIVRCEIADPKNELYPGMLATVAIQVQEPVESVAIPVNGVVREGDGTMTAWVTTDRRHFVQRIVKVGLQKDGMDQVLEGLQNGELAVTDGAIFLDNMLQAPPSD